MVVLAIIVLSSQRNGLRTLLFSQKVLFPKYALCDHYCSVPLAASSTVTNGTSTAATSSNTFISEDQFDKAFGNTSSGNLGCWYWSVGSDACLLPHTPPPLANTRPSLYVRA